MVKKGKKNARKKTDLNKKMIVYNYLKYLRFIIYNILYI